MRRPLDRLRERMDEGEAKLALYPPRAAQLPGRSLAILSVTTTDGAPPHKLEDDEPEPELFPFWEYP